MDTLPFDATAGIRRPNPRLMALSLCMIAIGVITIVLGSRPLMTLLVGAAALLLELGLGFLFLNVFSQPRAITSRVRVQADLSELRVGDGVIAREMIKHATLVATLGPPFVLVERRYRLPPLRIVVSDEAEGRRLLSAMGLDTTQSVVRFVLPMAAPPWKMGLVGHGLAGVWAGWFALCVALLASRLLAGLLCLAPLFLNRLTLVRVDVGSDGVLIRSFLRRRFIPSRDIIGVDLCDPPEGEEAVKIFGLSICLRGGEQVKLAFGRLPRQRDQRASLAQRIKDSMERQPGDAALAALLARGNRAVSDWVQALRSMGAGATTLRTPAVDAERLWMVLESSDADPRDRAAAATALSASDDSAARGRVRIVARAVAHPKLRVAMEAVCVEDDLALEAALGTLAAEG